MLQTCLLITDDPDDALQFSEAVNDITDDAVIVTISDPAKAYELLKSGGLTPDHIFLDLSSEGLNAALLTKWADVLPPEPGFSIHLYGNTHDREKVAPDLVFRFLAKDYTYLELHRYLTQLLNP